VLKPRAVPAEGTTGTWGGDHFGRMSGIKPRKVMIPLAERLGHCGEAGK